MFRRDTEETRGVTDIYRFRPPATPRVSPNSVFLVVHEATQQVLRVLDHALHGADEGRPEVLVDRLLGYPEGMSHPNGLELARMDEPIDGHLRDSHDRGHFGHGEEPQVAERCLCTHDATSKT